MAKLMTAEEAVKAYIKDGMTIATNGFVGAVQPEGMMRAIQKSFLEGGTPRDLTLVHAAGQGGGKMLKVTLLDRLTTSLKKVFLRKSSQVIIHLLQDFRNLLLKIKLLHITCHRAVSPNYSVRSLLTDQVLSLM